MNNKYKIIKINKINYSNGEKIYFNSYNNKKNRIMIDIN